VKISALQISESLLQKRHDFWATKLKNSRDIGPVHSAMWFTDKD